MSIAAPEAQLSPDAAGDLEYVRQNFRPMSVAARPLVERGVLPQATYVMPDGTAMVPLDHEALLQDAGGDPGAVEARFRERFLAAGGDPAQADEEHEAWLSGGYGICLRATTPEAIVAKGALVASITALLERADPADTGWRIALRASVDALDSLECQFAQFDRERFGGPVTRDRLITGVRERFPELWRTR